MPNKLSPSYLEHVAIGREALSTLNIGPLQIADGLTRCGFLFAQMESAATLPLATRVATLFKLLPNTHMKHKGISHASQWHSRLASVKGFCHLCLFTIDWVMPALCTLGAYPDACDVACLEAYFRSDFTNWGIYSQGLCCGHQVVHVRGSPWALSYTTSNKLCTLRGSLVGASYSNTPGHSGPPLPIPPAHLRTGDGSFWPPSRTRTPQPTPRPPPRPPLPPQLYPPRPDPRTPRHGFSNLTCGDNRHAPSRAAPTNHIPPTSLPGGEAPPVLLPALTRQLSMMP